MRSGNIELESILMTLFQSNRARLSIVLIAAFAAMSGPRLANAGPLSVTAFALNDGFGPDLGTWHGSASIAAQFFGDAVVADVDWAVFEPGKFQQYLNGQAIAQVDPSGPLELTYVYQITKVGTAVPGIDTLTVGVDLADARGTILPPTFVPTGAATEKTPTSGGDNNTSMAWFFNGHELHVGDTSSLLVFTSPFAPELDFLQVNSGLAGAFPIPPLVASISDRIHEFDVPEPAAGALALLCCTVLLCQRRSTL